MPYSRVLPSGLSSGGARSRGKNYPSTTFGSPAVAKASSGRSSTSTAFGSPAVTEASDRSIVRRLCRSIVVNREMSRKLSIYRSIMFCFYPHLWSRTLGSDRKNEITGEMSFLPRVAGLSLRDRVRNYAIWEELRVDPMLLQTKCDESDEVVRRPPECLPGKVFRAHPTGKSPPGRPMTGWMEYVSRLASGCLRTTVTVKCVSTQLAPSWFHLSCSNLVAVACARIHPIQDVGLRSQISYSSYSIFVLPSLFLILSLQPFLLLYLPQLFFTRYSSIISMGSHFNY